MYKVGQVVKNKATKKTRKVISVSKGVVTYLVKRGKLEFKSKCKVLTMRRWELGQQ